MENLIAAIKPVHLLFVTALLSIGALGVGGYVLIDDYFSDKDDNRRGCERLRDTSNNGIRGMWEWLGDYLEDNDLADAAADVERELNRRHPIVWCPPGATDPVPVVAPIAGGTVPHSAP